MRQAQMARRTALCGILAGMSLALLYVGALMPSMELAVPALCGLATLVVTLELGRRWAFAVYAVCAALSLALLGNKFPALLYAAFFGFYPIVKSILEQKLPKYPELACKILLINACLIAAYFAGRFVLGLPPQLMLGTNANYAKAAALALCNVTFMLYDFAMDKAVLFYEKKLRKRLGKAWR
jgi:hypothetical protein